MRSFDISDAEIQIMSSINLKVLPHLAHPQSAVGCNAQQCWPMWLSGYHRLWFRFFLYVQLVSILSDHIVQANVVQFDDDFTGLGAVVGMLLQCTFKSFCHSVSIQALSKELSHLLLQCKTLVVTSVKRDVFLRVIKMFRTKAGL